MVWQCSYKYIMSIKLKHIFSSDDNNSFKSPVKIGIWIYVKNAISFQYFLACQDNHSSCPSWAKSGVCNTNPAYALKECKFSCKNCKQGLGYYIHFEFGYNVHKTSSTRIFRCICFWGFFVVLFRGWLLRIILTKRCKFYFDFLNEFLKKKIDIIHNCDFYFSLHGPAHPLPTLVKEQPL